MNPAQSLLAELAARWAQPPVTLKVIGTSALALRVGYLRGTRDADVLETLDPAASAHLLHLAGPDSELALRWRVYVELVGRGLPFLPMGPQWHPVALPGAPDGIVSVLALDVVDVVVSKLKRFHANDRADIDAMVQAGHVTHGALVARFCSAVERFAGDARAEELPRYVRNLHAVERDMFFETESDIDLPDWI